MTHSAITLPVLDILDMSAEDRFVTTFPVCFVTVDLAATSRVNRTPHSASSAQSSSSSQVLRVKPSESKHNYNFAC